MDPRKPPLADMVEETENEAAGQSGAPASAQATREHGLVVIGNFDGVHLGHQTVIAQAAEQARTRGLHPRVLTFYPHPAEVLGRRSPAKLTTLHRKRELIARIAPDVELVVMTFDMDFAAQSPREFAERITHPPVVAKSVIVGANFRFGKDRAGNLDLLVELGAELGFEAQVETLVGDDAGPWSSTRARAALAAGDVEGAARILGRPHMVSGVVVSGDRRGRTLGFPTANLGSVEEAVVAPGVYAVVVDREDADGVPHALAKGAANVGTRPTVGGAEVRHEIHLFDLDEDLYGARLRCHFIRRLRAEMRFDGLDALRDQIARDTAEARVLLRDRKPAPDAGGAFF